MYVDAGATCTHTPSKLTELSALERHADLLDLVGARRREPGALAPELDEARAYPLFVLVLALLLPLLPAAIGGIGIGIGVAVSVVIVVVAALVAETLRGPIHEVGLAHVTPQLRSARRVIAPDGVGVGVRVVRVVVGGGPHEPVDAAPAQHVAARLREHGLGRVA